MIYTPVYLSISALVLPLIVVVAAQKRALPFSRSRYVVWFLGILFVYILAHFIGGDLIIDSVLSRYNETVRQQFHNGSPLAKNVAANIQLRWAILDLLIIAGFQITHTYLAIKRVGDSNWNGKLVWCLTIPIINIVLMLALMLPASRSSETLSDEIFE